MRNSAALLLLFFLLSCQEAALQKVNDSVSLDTGTNNTLTVIDSAATNPELEPLNPETSDYSPFTNEFTILIPTSYRDWEGRNDADQLQESWLSLVRRNKHFVLEAAQYKIARGFDPCVGDSTKIIEAEEAILFLNNPAHRSGAVQAVDLPKKMIWPTKKISFNFNNKMYTLRAIGKVTSKNKINFSDDEEAFREVENYELLISSATDPETLLLAQHTFNDTFIEILFIGDLDRDGRPDFIFRANRDYEEERVVVYLSSRAKSGQAARKVSEIAVQFDC